MRLRLSTGADTLAEWQITSPGELTDRVSRFRSTHPDVDALRYRVTIHLWFDGSWWNLSADLEQFCTWLDENEVVAPGRVRAFARDPLSNPEWLFRAAAQMTRLLKAACPLVCDPRP